MLLTKLGKWFWDPIKNVDGATSCQYTQAGRQDAQRDEAASKAVWPYVVRAGVERKVVQTQTLSLGPNSFSHCELGFLFSQSSHQGGQLWSRGALKVTEHITGWKVLEKSPRI